MKRGRVSGLVIAIIILISAIVSIIGVNITGYYIIEWDETEVIRLVIADNTPTAQEIINEAVSYYKFDEDAKDSVGENDGIFHGDAHIGTDYEKGNVLVLDGNEDYVKISTSSDLNLLGNSITLSAWIRPEKLEESYDAIIPISMIIISSDYSFIVFVSFNPSRKSYSVVKI